MIEVSVLIVYIAGRHWVVREYQRNSIKQLPAQKYDSCHREFHVVSSQAPAGNESNSRADYGTESLVSTCCDVSSG